MSRAQISDPLWTPETTVQISVLGKMEKVAQITDPPLGPRNDGPETVPAGHLLGGGVTAKVCKIIKKKKSESSLKRAYVF